MQEKLTLRKKYLLGTSKSALNMTRKNDVHSLLSALDPEKLVGKLDIDNLDSKVEWILRHIHLSMALKLEGKW